MPTEKQLNRCSWVDLTKEDYVAYHDREWGVPVHDDRLLFEFIILEGAQAGLSWYTVLRKRESYRAAFDNFEPEIVAEYDDAKVAELLGNPGIIRNRLKVHAAIGNAKGFLDVQKEFGSFDAYIWGFVRRCRDSSHIARVGRSQQGPSSKRLQIRRVNHLLRAHAGHRHGQRPYSRLLPSARNYRRLLEFSSSIIHLTPQLRSTATGK